MITLLRLIVFMLLLIGSNQSTLPSLYAPVLQVSSLEGYVPENANIGTTVQSSPISVSESLQILVTDEDLRPGMQPATYQYILTGLGATIFAVDQQGFVYLNVANIDADPPGASTFQLNVQAREVDTVPIRSSQTVSLVIHILDANDNAPVFASKVYTAVVDAIGNNNESRKVLSIIATDIDAGKFGQIHYDIESVTNDADHLFRYDTTNNALMVVGNLQPNQQYQIVLRAVDGGGKIGRSLIVVDAREASTLSRTDNHHFHHQNESIRTSPQQLTVQTIVTEINEATPAGSVVVALQDYSTVNNVLYSIVGGNGDDRFRINADGGTIYTALTLDRETTQMYSLQVEGRRRNESSPVQWTVVQVIVIDVNDNAPAFIDPKYPIIFKLNYSQSAVAQNIIVGRVVVEDKDDGDNGRVELQIKSPENRYFSIDSNGNIRIIKKIPTNVDRFELKILAKDHGAPPLETLALAVVQIVNMVKVTTSRSEGHQLMESSTFASVVTSKQNRQFMQTNIPSQTREAAIFEHAQLRVDIAENEAPVDVLVVKASYMDEQQRGDTITYTLLNGDPTLFKIDSLTGRLRLLRALDAEADTVTYAITVGTVEMNSLIQYEHKNAYTCTIAISVTDVNDWIPNFKAAAAATRLSRSTLPGTVVMQVEAFDNDRSTPNNLINYRTIDDAHYFSINPMTGIITLTNSMELYPNDTITIAIEAVDGGIPSLSSQKSVTFTIETIDNSLIIIDNNRRSFGNNENIHFGLGNYSTSISEGASSSFVQILPVHNKPSDIRLIYCNIVSGNYGGVFTATTASDGNCELRSQLELDRESVERYILNVTVSTNSESSSSLDYTMVSIAVLDVNDNVPRFVFNNDLGIKLYFAGVSSSAETFSRILVVKAIDADVGNNSLVQYSLSTTSVDAKYFGIDASTGELTTKQSMKQLFNKRRVYFELRIEAKDSPMTGKWLNATADAIVNVITDQHRFLMTAKGIQPEQLRSHEGDMVRSLRQFTGPCTLLFAEKVSENNQLYEQQTGSDIYWYAINPVTRRVCLKSEYRSLFSSESVALIGGKMQPWFVVERLTENLSDAAVLIADDGRSIRWMAAPIALIILASFIAIGAFVGIIVMCLFWSRYKLDSNGSHNFPPMYRVPKFGTLILPGAPSDKIYETQILEMPITDEDFGMKNGSNNIYKCSNRRVQNADEGDFSIEENMYAINVPGRYDPSTRRMQTVVIPPPDYPINHHQHKSLL